MTGLWIRLELRNRGRSLVALALLVALAVTTVLTALAGARRADSAVDRLWAASTPATYGVLPNMPGLDWAAVRALPQVEALGAFLITSFEVRGRGLGWFPAIDDQYGLTVERPVVLEGRMWDPAAPDEMVVTAATGHHPGDVVDVRLYAPEQFASDMTTAARGPVVAVRVVGVVRSNWFRDEVGHPGYLHPGPGFLAAHRANLEMPGGSYANALVRLKGDPAGFREGLARVTGRQDIDMWDMSSRIADHDREVVRFGAAVLLTFGLAALAAALVLVGQSVSRSVAASAAALRPLRAAGLAPRQAAVTAAVAPALAALAGALSGGLGAYLASGLMPLGAAGLREPDPGRHFDALVLIPGMVSAPLFVFGWGVLAAFMTGRGSLGGSLRGSQRPSRMARLGLPVPIAIGARFALEPGRDGVPVRPALLGAVTGVLGVLAAFTFAAGVEETGHNPEAFGQTHQFVLPLGVGGEDPLPQDAIDAGRRSIAADPDVTGLTDTRLGVAVSGGTAVSLFSREATGIRVVTMEGALPKRTGEVMLAPHSARALGAGVGDRITLTGTRTAALTVTGIGFVPEASHNTYASGGWVTDATYDALFDGFKLHAILISARPGTDPGALRTRIAAAVGEPDVPLEPVGPPFQLGELQEHRVLPIALAAFLAILGVGAVGHALATAVRRRAHELAVLRAIGLTRVQARLIVVTQATLLAVAGLAFGVPLGLAAGRVVWRVTADVTPLLHVPPVAGWALLLVGPLTLLIANLLAAWPGRTASRLPAGLLLRSE
ncbi:ABC transporter permease [Herbidospora mongoliensis]|uniref:ABC transporter permease n=1 Tax=Herbidospora mongoliensis TaxID=688067 RepID=UPI00083200C6|nr:FtsX-like permease family protein [Herbidospora mongoliensis]